MRVALDIGHMGKRSRPEDRGAVYNNYREADFALDYSIVARKHLEANGNIVFLLTYDNYSNRQKFCDAIKTDVHIQCHINSPDGRYALIGYRDDSGDTCVQLSEILSHQLKTALGDVISKVEVKVLKGDERGYDCLKNNIPSLLFEPLFIQNDAHLKFMLYEDGITKIGIALAGALNEWRRVSIKP